MLTSGFLLIASDAPRPRCVEVEAGSYPDAWMSIKHTLTSQQLEEELSAKGWTLHGSAPSGRWPLDSIVIRRLSAESVHQGRKAAEMQVPSD